MELEARGGDPQPPQAGVPGGAAPVRAAEPEPGAEASEAAPVRRLKPSIGRLPLSRKRSVSARDMSHITGTGVGRASWEQDAWTHTASLAMVRRMTSQ